MSDATIEYCFPGFRLDSRHKRLFTAQGDLVTLSARPFDALLTLLEHRGEVLSREELLEAVWPRLFVEENNLTQAISTVRKALHDTTGESQFIRTVPGRGYCFIAPVETHECAPPVLPEPAGSATVPDALPVLRRLRPLEILALLLVILIAVVALRPTPQASQAGLAGVDMPAPLGVSEIPPPDSRIRNSVVVLPLATLGSESDELFAAGLHDEVISQLTRIESLNVIGRSSVVTLLDQGLSTLDLTRVLRVESILSGTIRLAGSQARISLQLVDVATGVTLWSDTYDVDQQDLARVISVQGDIAVNVATALKAEIPQLAQGDVTALPTEVVEAYRYNLAAHKAHDHQKYAEEWRLAQKAIELDPDFYEALYTFASVNVVLVTNPLPGMTSRQHAELALQHANHMIAIAPERSEGYAVKAVTLAARKDWVGVAAAVAALEDMHAPLSSLEYVAPVIMSFGAFDRAVDIYETNLVTELLNPYARGFLMLALELAGQRAEVQRQYAIGDELHAQWWGDAVAVFLALGRNETPRDVEQLVGISDELKYLLQRPNDSAAVHAALKSYRDKAAKRPLEARYYAALAARLGEHEVAVELLRASLQEVWGGMFWAWLPVFDATRQQESFRQLLHESGLVAYWKQHGWPRICQPYGEDFRCDWRAYPGAFIASP